MSITLRRNKGSALTHNQTDDNFEHLENEVNGKENSIGSKGTAFNKNFGTEPGTVCEGNDPRLSGGAGGSVNNTVIINTRMFNKGLFVDDSTAEVVVEKYAYILGGFYDSSALSSFDRYTRSNNAMHNLPNIPVSIMGHGSGKIGSNIYIWGGIVAESSVSTLRRYNISSQFWETITPSSGTFTARSNGGCCAHDGKLYYVSGSTNDTNAGVVTNLDVYDPATNTITALAPTTVGRRGTKLVSVGSVLVLVGGRTSDGSASNRCDIYAPLTDTWSQRTNMTAARGYSAVAAFNGKVYVFGGEEGGGTPYKDCQIFDVTANTWSAGADLPTTGSVGITNFDAKAFSNSIYISGGSLASGYYEELGILYDPLSNTYQQHNDYGTNRRNHTIV